MPVLSRNIEEYILYGEYLPAGSEIETIALQDQADKQIIIAEYQNMRARLEQIKNAPILPFTQAGFNQLAQAVKDEALYIERMAKIFKAMFT